MSKWSHAPSVEPKPSFTLLKYTAKPGAPRRLEEVRQAVAGPRTVWFVEARLGIFVAQVSFGILNNFGGLLVEYRQRCYVDAI